MSSGTKERTFDSMGASRPGLKNLIDKRAAIPILGTVTDQRRQLDKKRFASEKERQEAAAKLHRERQARKGDNSLYAMFQQWHMPTGKELVRERVDVNWPMGDNECEWCQGLVEKKLINDPPTVMIKWDPMPDVKDWDEETEAVKVVLDPAKWRKNVQYGWRLDLDVELFENYYSEEDEIGTEEVLDIVDKLMEEEADNDDDEYDWGAGYEEGTVM